MPFYLNQDNELFAQDINDDIYVDKSMLIKETNDSIRKWRKFMCVTRPRRFGKSMALSMLNAYYSKGCDSRELFKNLKIYGDPSFEEHLNKHNVIWLDLTGPYCESSDKSTFVDRLKQYILDDLAESFPEIDISSLTPSEAICEIGSRLHERFIFLIDEWDIVYRERGEDKALCSEFGKFLCALFKSSYVSPYIDLVYMTGIFPIERFALRGDLDNFIDYDAANPWVTRESIGYTEEEVKELCERWGKDFSEIKSWFGAYLMDGKAIYNPISVNNAIKDRCEGRWVFTASREPLAQCMDFGAGELKGDFEALMDGERLPVRIRLLWGDFGEIKNREQALTTLIYLGYLGYDEESKECFIPNKEIAKDVVLASLDLKWDEMAGAMLSPDWKGRP